MLEYNLDITHGKIPVLSSYGNNHLPESTGHLGIEFFCKKQQEFVAELLKIYRKSNLNPFLYGINAENQNKVYFTSVTNASEQNYVKDRLANHDPRFMRVLQLPNVNKKIIEINVIVTDDQVDLVLQLIPPHPEIYIHQMHDIYTPGFTWIEVVPREGNKKDALIFLKNYLQVKRVVCFGDNTNDIPMFEVADEGCAVENAVSELKTIATRIIQANYNNGVVKYLRKLIQRLD